MAFAPRRAALWPVLGQATRTQRTLYPQTPAALADAITAGPRHIAPLHAGSRASRS
ncbi:hypothetical protein ACH4KT_28170 [Streptomyces anulatus]